MKRMLFLSLVTLLSSTSSIAQSAADILEATGITGGLVVHVGCGDGTLTAALCAGEGYLVQGLDVDVETVAQAHGKVMSV